jgi:hypothetical protein
MQPVEQLQIASLHLQCNKCRDSGNKHSTPQKKHPPHICCGLPGAATAAAAATPRARATAPRQTPVEGSLLLLLHNIPLRLGMQCAMNCAMN